MRVLVTCSHERVWYRIVDNINGMSELIFTNAQHHVNLCFKSSHIVKPQSPEFSFCKMFHKPPKWYVPSTNRDMTLKTSPRKCLGNKKTCFKLLGKDFFTYSRADRLPCRKLNINYEMISITDFKPLICKKNIKIHFVPHWMQWMASYTLGSFSHKLSFLLFYHYLIFLALPVRKGRKSSFLK